MRGALIHPTHPSGGPAGPYTALSLSYRVYTQCCFGSKADTQPQSSTCCFGDMAGAGQFVLLLRHPSSYYGTTARWWWGGGSVLWYALPCKANRELDQTDNNTVIII